MVIQLDCADDESFWETKVNPTLLYIRSNLATCSGRLVLSPSLSLSFFSFLYVTNNGLDLTRLKWLKAAPTSTTVRYDDQLLGSLQTVSIFRFLHSASRVIGNCIQHPSVSRQKLTQGDNDGYCELKSTPTKRGWMERTPSIFFFKETKKGRKMWKSSS